MWYLFSQVFVFSGSHFSQRGKRNMQKSCRWVTLFTDPMLYLVSSHCTGEIYYCLMASSHLWLVGTKPSTLRLHLNSQSLLYAWLMGKFLSFFPSIFSKVKHKTATNCRHSLVDYRGFLFLCALLYFSSECFFCFGMCIILSESEKKTKIIKVCFDYRNRDFLRGLLTFRGNY